MKGKVQSQQQQNISYRSYKNFDVDIFNSELIQVAFPDIENIDYKFWHLQSSVPKNHFSWISFSV
jgi:hypothetical protein